MTGDGGTPQVAMAQGRRSRGRQAWRARPARWRWLPALLCVLATVLSVTLSACGSFGESTCSPAGDARQKPPFYGLTVSRPIAAGGVVYVSYAIPDATPHNPDQHHYIIAALRARDGMALWRVPAASETSPLAPAPLAVADGILVVFDRGAGGLVGLRACDGTTLWHAMLDGDMTLKGSVLYVTANDGVRALRLADGHLLWQYPMVSGPLLDPPVVDGTAVYIAVGDGSVVALQAATGAVRWTAFPGFKPLSPLSPADVWYIPKAVSAGHLYVTTVGVQGKEPGVLRLNTVNGTSGGYVLRLPENILAEYPALLAGDFSAVLLPILLSDATPSGPPPTLEVYRLSASGSELLWRSPPLEDLFMPVGLAHDAQTLYFEVRRDGAPRGVIYAFRLADGAELWRQQALTDESAGIDVDAGYFFETVAGVNVPQICHAPPVHQAPRIRALTSADGGVAWTQALDATR